MRRPIEMRIEFIAAALVTLMHRHGITEFEFTEEEFYLLGINKEYLKLTGKFEASSDSVPTSCILELVDGGGGVS